MDFHQTSETGKHVADSVAGVSIFIAWVEILTPVFNFIALILAIIWGVYRIHDMRLSNKLKQRQLDDDHS